MTSLAAPAARRFVPPRLARDVVDARTHLTRVREVEVTLGGTAWTLSMEPLADAAPTGFGADDWRVLAQWDGARFELRLPATAADAWLHARFPALDLPLLPAPVRSATVELALQELLSACEGLGGEPPRIDAVESPAPEHASALAHRFALALHDGPVTLWATLCTDTLGLMALARLAQPLAAADGPLADDPAPVRLAAEIGAATLSRAELASLRPGDAIVVQHCWIDAEAQLWLRQGRWGLRVREVGAKLVVTEPFRSLENHMDEADDLDGLDSAFDDELDDGFDDEDGVHEQDADAADDLENEDDLDEIDDLDDLDRLVDGRHAAARKARAEAAAQQPLDDAGDDEPQDGDPLDDDEPADEDDAAAELDALPVQLRFDLGERSLPLSELVQLQVGQVLELSRPLSQAVSIRANGKRVGIGELAEIGGRLAVVVTSLGRRARDTE